MNIYILPNKNLLVPSGIADKNTLSDGLQEVEPNTPLYKKWMTWAQNVGQLPIPFSADDESTQQESHNAQIVDDGLKGNDS